MSKQARDFFGVVKGGNLSPAVRDAISKLLGTLEGKSIKVTISLPRRKRSDPQNRFYYGVILPLVHKFMWDSGVEQDIDIVHIYLKGRVGGMTTCVSDPLTGEVSFITDSSTKLTTGEWEDWITRIRVWAAERGLEIPFPNEEM